MTTTHRSKLCSVALALCVALSPVVSTPSAVADPHPSVAASTAPDKETLKTKATAVLTKSDKEKNEELNKALEQAKKIAEGTSLGKNFAKQALTEAGQSLNDLREKIQNTLEDDTALDDAQARLAFQAEVSSLNARVEKIIYLVSKAKKQHSLTSTFRCEGGIDRGAHSGSSNSDALKSMSSELLAKHVVYDKKTGEPSCVPGYKMIKNDLDLVFKVISAMVSIFGVLGGIASVIGRFLPPPPPR